MEKLTDTFGKFLRQKRESLGKTLRGMAAEIGIAPSYMSDLEHDKRYPPTGELLRKMKEYLLLTPEEDNYFNELVGLGRGEVAPDMTEFLQKNEIVRDMVRRLMEVDENIGAHIADYEEMADIFKIIEKMKIRK